MLSDAGSALARLLADGAHRPLGVLMLAAALMLTAAVLLIA